LSLPQLQLDDRDFQSLVDQARSRIAQTCPAWDEHNVSDPGITLIELFAWMTDLLIYRVNRIPEKAQIALLAMMGVTLAPAQVAKADLRFLLSAPAASRVQIETGAAEVAASGPTQSEQIAFHNVEPISIPPLQLQAMRLVRHGALHEVPVQEGLAQMRGSAQPGLWSLSQPQDGIYLGFLDSLSCLVVAVGMAAVPAWGAGIAPQAPPWIWEVSQQDGGWVPAAVLSDGTGGLNYASGTVELQLPRASGEATIAGRRLHWLRCRLLEAEGTGAAAESTGAAGYTRAPRIERVSVAAIGALVRAEHATPAVAASAVASTDPAVAAGGEIVGYSDGSPGQVFHVRHAPALELTDGEGLEVMDPHTRRWVPWILRDSLADSKPDDLHYCFDPVSGEVCLGLAIRERESWVQRGKIPADGAALRMRYRSGGGAQGNVAAGTLSVMRRALPGIASVTNPEPAHGGVDAESLAEVLRSAPLEIHTRSRAVTAEDHEVLAVQASRRVARARCLMPRHGEAVLCILPKVSDPARLIPNAELDPPEDLLQHVALRLDEMRLLGSSLRVVPMALCGVTVVAEVETDVHTEPAEVERSVAEALYRYVNPYVGGSLAGESEGWRFGRPLVAEEVKLAIRAVPGVEEVLLLRLYRTDLQSGARESRPVQGQLQPGPDELVASAEHVIRARRSQAQ
jgi:predicted phage baseplate assembly protein